MLKINKIERTWDLQHVSFIEWCCHLYKKLNIKVACDLYSLNNTKRLQCLYHQKLVKCCMQECT